MSVGKNANAYSEKSSMKIDYPSSKKRAGKKKLGTTVLERTEYNISMFKEQYSDEYKTPGEVIDLMARLCLRVNPSVAVKLCEFCEHSIKDAQKELYGRETASQSPLQAVDLVSQIEYLRALENHMSRFVPEDYGSEDQPMKRINMRGSSYLLIPEEWVVVNEGDARSCDYAFVLETRNWKKDKVPHFVYLSPKEVCPNNEVINAVIATWPKMTDIRAKQVKPFYDKQGVMLNPEEWSDAPTIGVFPILDATSFSQSDEAPFGAMICRR